MTTDFRRFRATLDTVLAAALARHDAGEQGTRQSPTLRFQLKAAASSEAPVLPTTPWRDVTQAVEVSVEPLGDDVQIHLQAVGFAALGKVAGKAGLLVSSDASIAVRFRFDAAGRASIRLAGTPNVGRALADFSIQVS